MNPLRNLIESVLEHDPVLQAKVGYTEQEDSLIRRYKIYELLAPANTEAPYIVWQVIPGAEPGGHYGDLNAIENLNAQITCWGRDNDEAWDLFHTTKDALESGEVNMDADAVPYELLTFICTGDQFSIPDLTTRWVQVPSTWRIVLAR